MRGTEETFDYIVVGAGAAGCLLANRLSADPQNRVALIEAGPSDRAFPTNWKTSLPIGNVTLLPHERYTWRYAYKGGSSVHGRDIPCPRGRLTGGCTSLNGALYIRGHAADYDGWAASGAAGWTWPEVLRGFTQHERWTGPRSSWHGTQGELDTGPPRDPNVLTHAFLQAAREAGHPTNDDFNGEVQDGFGFYHLNQRRGVRMSSARAFLQPALNRANLRLLEDTLVERIVFTGRRAAGVAIRTSSGRRVLRAREVIVAAGAINSPQLLMVSGIGPARSLAALGVAPIHDSPGVGANLHDHPTVAVAVENPSGESYALTARALPRILASPFRYLLARKGMLASNAVESGGFIRSPAAVDRPDLQIGFLVGLKDSARVIPTRHGCVVLTCLLQPHSRGRLTLASSDIAVKPVLNHDMLDDPRDVAALVHGLKEVRRILRAPALKAYLGAELTPGGSVSTDAELEDHVRRTAATSYHPVGTCKMGPATDPMAVVAPDLRVHGVEGLRVIDASIMPTVTSGNTSAPTMMIAERGAQFILGDRQHATAQDQRGQVA